MSDDWLDRSYRSDESPPAEVDAKVLSAARRATRRWVLPLIAAAVLTITALAVLGFLVTRHEQYVPSASGADFTVPAERTAVDTEEFYLPEAGPTNQGSDPNLYGSSAAPPKVDLPDMRTEALLDARRFAESFPDISCEEPATHRLPDGHDRGDGGEPCIDALRLRIGSEPGSDRTDLQKPDM